jgi:nitroreductase
MDIIDTIKKSVDVSLRAQRNFDLNKSISDKDLEVLIYAAANAPSKQNENHYSLKVYTDQQKIKSIYDQTKRFTLHFDRDFQKIVNNETKDYWPEDYCVKNSQILSNAIFVYLDDNSNLINWEHKLGESSSKEEFSKIYSIQKSYSIGISVGQLILSAALLGYKTGICTAFDDERIKEIIGTTENIKMIVGIGFENKNLDRRAHPEVLNKDVPIKSQNGHLEENWKFPSYNKVTKVSINDD